jgi:hypothetical protein
MADRGISELPFEPISDCPTLTPARVNAGLRLRHDSSGFCRLLRARPETTWP